MTNAVSQNLETNKDLSINAILSMEIKTDSKNQNTNESTFSNLMNCANANTEKTKSNFVDKAVKSNTSSINKLALQATKKPVKAEQKAKLNETDNTFATKTPVQTKQQATEEKSVATKPTNEQTSTIAKTNQTPQEAPTKKINENVKNEKNVCENNETSNLSDINNSSFVEASPVISLEETQEIETEVEIETTDFVEVLAPVVDLQNTNETTNEKIDKLLASLENNEETKHILEELNNLLNDSSLNQEDKNSLAELFENIKSINENSKETVDFKNISASLQEELNSTLDKLSEKLSEIKNNIDENLSQDIQVDTVDFTKTQDSVDLKIEKDNKNIEVEKENKNIEISDKKEIEVNVENKNSKEIKLDTNDENIKLQAKVEIKDEKEVSNEIKIDDKSNDDKIEIELNNESKVITDDDKKEILDTLNKIISKVDSNEDEKISMDEILETVKTFEDLTNILPKEDLKEKISEVVDFIKENSQEIEIKQEDLISTINALKDEIKSYINEEKETVDTTLETTETKTVAVDETQSKTQNNLDLTKDNNKTAQTATQENQVDEISLKDLQEMGDFEIPDNQDFQINKNVEKTTVKNSNIDIKQTQENLQKAIYTQEILDDMLISSNYSKISEQSGALSVADEIAKMAIESTNSLSSANAQGSVIYDNASGNGTLIKNAASLIRTTQTQNQPQDFKMADVMNQIGDKIQQLKDGQGQRLTMVLRPNDLGRLSLELTSNNLGLTTNIMAQNEDVRAYIEKNIDVLRQQLTDAGVKVNSIQIKTAGQAESTNYEGNQNFQNNEANQDNLAKHNQDQNQQQNNKQQQGNKEILENVISMNNYDMHFAKDFSSILNKAINYGS